MSKPTVLEKTPMNVVEVKAALAKIKKTEEELNFRAEKTEEYAQDFARISQKAAKELVTKLTELGIPRLKEVHVHKLIDLLPTSEKQVKMILSGYHMTVTNDSVKKIVTTITDCTKA